MNLFLYDLVMVTVKDMLRSIDPVATGCYYMFGEFYISLLQYQETFLKWEIFSYNLIHNLGDLWDDIECLDCLFKYEFNYQEEWYAVGSLFGALINNVFFKTRSFDGNVLLMAQQEPPRVSLGKRLGLSFRECQLDDKCKGAATNINP